ncbi:MAG: flagellar biosynthetic protein FlhB [Bacillota bacterium]|nr:MAG: flagellar biosynthetic protein FlhB [Bacillota bacterium]
MSSPQGGAQEKTEQASPKRLSDARSKGQVAKSMDLVAAIGFFGTVMIFAAVSGDIITNSINYLTQSMAQLSQANSFEGSYGLLFINAMTSFAGLVWPMLVAAMGLGVLANVAQVGFLASLEPLQPSFSRLDPIEGVKRMFSMKALFDLLKAFLKLALVGYAAYLGIRGEIATLLLVGYTEGLGALVVAGSVLMRVAVRVGVVYLVIGIADFMFQRYEHSKNMKMSKHEVKEEHKQVEGDPQIKARQRERQRTLATRRMFSEIPTATVVITNPTHFAVVLKYDENGGAPVVCAKGCDYLAQRIIAKAKEHRVPVISEPPVARALYKQVELGREIPIDLYRVVAEILATIFAQKGRL